MLTLSTAVGVTRNLVWRGVTIEYSHISDRLYFGFEPRDGYNLALPEKALLDGIYYRISFRLRMNSSWTCWIWIVCGRWLCLSRYG